MTEIRRHTGTGGAARTARTGCPDGSAPVPERPERQLASGILDETVLRDLDQDLGQETARRFADQFAAGLRRRLELLTVAALDGSVYAVYDTAADLAVTGAMVGAVPLAQAAWAVAQDVARTRTVPEVDTLIHLMRLAHHTEAALLRRSRTGTPAP
ncbi:hypothetical protein ACH47X_23950 [Promicromonospora kroppenstedtii]|uniref:Hpt domain-containing protein n=1 Tax=Promicromonospora kroppenstedtii TaxID=440482 RepID=A0ABW7XR03_9MICO